MPEPIPEHLGHLPVHRGMPVPDVVAWSSEGRIVVRHDPIAGRDAVFTRGRQGRGRPVFGVMSPDRQRRAVLAAFCQVCGRGLDEETGWLPNHPRLIDTYDQAGNQYVMEPPCCEPCARWAATGCPGIRGTVTDLIEVLEIQPVAQLLDLAEFARRRPDRFDDRETPATIAHLTAIAARNPGGVMGYARYQLLKTEPHPL